LSETDMQKLPNSNLTGYKRNLSGYYWSSTFALHCPVFWGFLQKPSAGIHILKE